MSSRQALGLEPWGRLKIDYLGLDVSLPWIQDRAHSLGISPEDLREGVASVLDYLRRGRALHDPEYEIFTKYWREGDREIQQGYLPSFINPNATKLRREATEKAELITQWLSDRGDTTIRQIARKWGVPAPAVEPVLESLFDMLVERGLLVSVRLKGSYGRALPNVHGAYQVSADRLRLSPNKGVRRCRSCRAHDHPERAASALPGLAVRRRAGVGAGRRRQLRSATARRRLSDAAPGGTHGHGPDR